MDFFFRLENELERSINYVISISAAIAFIFGTTFSLIFGIGIDDSL